MTDDDALLLAVEALTKPRTSKVVQSKNGIECISPVNLPPLLETLDTMIRETMGGSAGGTLKSQQNILDTDALWRFIRINNSVNDWARLAGSTITKPDSGKTLAAWFVVYRQKNRDYEEDKFYLKHLWSWAAEIEGKIEPPRIMDLPDPCPVCDARTWWNPKTREEYARPLVITFREGEIFPDGGRGLCRACDTAFGVRELAYALEQKAAEQAAS
ncbi:hypothetical protein [Rathayibacter sp. VKM Ac-2630]|uniref:hypothetical protein n=1 Tax=Rathayibacter sp. VKM Ac-2630 TaxID=1938617 RepID=UPI000980B817|nr:hypothetical protein [Rathayibacter sp. VKM Ac-2630]OOB91201.1 hypothetical protein B0T42_07330 [Rathayibacter sp. VKM Ac-2630]